MIAPKENIWVNEDKTPFYTKEEEKAAFEKLRSLERKGRTSEAQQLKEEIFKHYTRLVISRAEKYMGRYTDFNDLIQEGGIGLTKAVDGYDFRRDFRFLTYATRCINHAIISTLYKRDIIWIPLGTYKRAREIEEIANDDHGNIESACRKEGLSRQDTDRVIKAIKAGCVVSLDDATFYDAESNSYDIACDPFEKDDMPNLRKLIAESELNYRERKIIGLRFLNPSKETLKKVGKKFGITKERVRQIQEGALKKLREPYKMIT